MPSGGGGSQPPAGASGTGTGAAANVYTPQNQPGIDAGLQGLFGQMYGPALTGLQQLGSVPPAGQAWPYVQQAAAQTYNNPYAGQAQNTANQVGSFGNTFNQDFAAQGQRMVNEAQNTAGFGQNLQGLAFDPIYQSALSQLEANPYFSQAMGGAQQGAGIGQQGAQQGAQNSAFLSGQIPQFAQLAGQAASAIPNVQGLAQQTAALSPQVAALAGPVAAPMQGLQQAGQSVWNTAQDPQQALYNRTLNQVQQQQNAQNAMSGIAGTPYGAGIAGDATRNFNIDWQNQQLQRQATGAQALGQADTAAAGLGATAGNLLTGAGAMNQAAGGLYGTGSQMATQAAAALDLGGQAAQTDLGLSQGSANLAAGSAALPSQALQSNLAAQTNAANQGLQAGLSGVQGIDQLIGAEGNEIAQGSGITNNALSSLLSQGQAPYNTSIGQAQNAFTGLGNMINYGNQNYTLPQQVINNAESYLGLGQSASGLSGQLGQLGVGQQNQALQGIGQAAGLGSNLLFGNQGLTGALGLGSSGLLGALGGGGGGGAAATLGSSAAAGADLASGATADVAGGFSAADLLPAAALS